MSNNIAKRVIEVRKAVHLNQTQFAERLNLQRSIISLCESEKREFSERTLRDISAIFSVNLFIFYFTFIDSICQYKNKEAK